jgi:prepilin-type N-terminal cleavage/methylation domain-containing protein
MTRLRRQDAGFTLVEVLLVSVLMTVILGATMSIFAAMERNQRASYRLNAMQDDARNVIDQVAKQLRSVASPSDNVFKPIERAEPRDVIFRTVRKQGTGTATNPANIQRVRYCLTSDRRLFLQTQVLADASAAPPVGSACPQPGSLWTTQRLINGQVVNGARPVFAYMLAMPGVNNFQEFTSVPGDAELERIVSIRAEIFVDDDVNKRPLETGLNTRVFLRNQNIKPSAAFTATPTSGMRLQLNGGSSEDPEGGRLVFQWYDNAIPGTDKKIGEGVVFLYSPVVGNHQIYLTVTDPGGNLGTAATQNFNCQTSTGCS